MPYIDDKGLREFLDSSIFRITDKAKDPGAIVYTFYKTLKVWVKTRQNNDSAMPKLFRGHKFYLFCWAMGILVCTGLEFYRRVISPYEDKQKERYGDV